MYVCPHPHPFTGKDMVPEQEVKVQEAPEARRQPARQRPYPHVPLSALPDHPADMGRLGLFQRSKHDGQQLHARLLSLVFIPASRLDAEIESWRRPLGLEGGLRCADSNQQLMSARTMDAGRSRGPLRCPLCPGAVTKTRDLTISSAAR